MHICEDLNQRLEELKKKLGELDSLAQAVTDADSKQALESLKVDDAMKQNMSKFEIKKNELEGMKLNFKKEMAEYLGISEDILSSGDNKFELDEKGYLVKLFCSKPIFSRRDPDFSVTHLEEIDLRHSNVQSVKVSDKTRILSLRGCTLSDPNPDFSATNLEEINLSDSNVESVKVGDKTTSLDLGSCTLSDPNPDFSATNLKKINLNQSNVQSVKVSDKTISLFLFECKLSDLNLDLSATNLENINLGDSNVQILILSAKQKWEYKKGKLIISGIREDRIRIKPT